MAKSKIAPSYIIDALHPLCVPIGDVHVDPANVRKHNARNIDGIVASLKTFKQQRPILVDARGTILAGNGTYTAAMKLEWTHIAIIKSDLIGSNATAYAIADNRLAELAEWDLPALSAQLIALKSESIDFTAIGYVEHELAPLLNAQWNPPPITNEPGAHIGEPGGNDPTSGPRGEEALQLGVTVAERSTIEEAVRQARLYFTLPAGAGDAAALVKIIGDWQELRAVRDGNAADDKYREQLQAKQDAKRAGNGLATPAGGVNGA